MRGASGRAMVGGMSRRGPRTSRGGSAVALALLVVAQLLALWHAAEVQHVRCSTHGELVEAARLADHHGDGIRLVGVHEGARVDDHCEIAGSLHHAATTAEAPLAVSELAPALRVLLVPVGTVPSQTVYLFAPKTSPPDHRVSVT